MTKICVWGVEFYTRMRYKVLVWRLALFIVFKRSGILKYLPMSYVVKYCCTPFSSAYANIDDVHGGLRHTCLTSSSIVQQYVLSPFIILSMCGLFITLPRPYVGTRAPMRHHSRDLGAARGERRSEREGRRTRVSREGESGHAPGPSPRPVPARRK